MKEFYIMKIDSARPAQPVFVALKRGTIAEARDFVASSPDGTYLICTPTSSPIVKTSEKIEKVRLQFEPATKRRRKGNGEPGATAQDIAAGKDVS